MQVVAPPRHVPPSSASITQAALNGSDTVHPVSQTMPAAWWCASAGELIRMHAGLHIRPVFEHSIKGAVHFNNPLELHSGHICPPPPGAALPDGSWRCRTVCDEVAGSGQLVCIRCIRGPAHAPHAGISGLRGGEPTLTTSVCKLLKLAWLLAWQASACKLLPLHAGSR